MVQKGREDKDLMFRRRKINYYYQNKKTVISPQLQDLRKLKKFKFNKIDIR